MHLGASSPLPGPYWIGTESLAGPTALLRAAICCGRRGAGISVTDSHLAVSYPSFPPAPSSSLCASGTRWRSGRHGGREEGPAAGLSPLIRPAGPPCGRGCNRGMSLCHPDSGARGVGLEFGDGAARDRCPPPGVPPAAWRGLCGLFKGARGKSVVNLVKVPGGYLQNGRVPALRRG